MMCNFFHSLQTLRLNCKIRKTCKKSLVGLAPGFVRERTFFVISYDMVESFDVVLTNISQSSCLSSQLVEKLKRVWGEGTNNEKETFCPKSIESLISCPSEKTGKEKTWVYYSTNQLYLRGIKRVPTFKEIFWSLFNQTVELIFLASNKPILKNATLCYAKDTYILPMQRF